MGGTTIGILINSIRLVTLALLATALISCVPPFVVGDGALYVSGHVYEVVTPGSPGGSILIDPSTTPAASGLAPVEGCTVTVEPWSATRRPHAESAELWTSRGQTDREGFFNVGGTAAPGRYEATISVECAGFDSITKGFRHDRFRHRAIVTVIRRTSK